MQMHEVKTGADHKRFLKVAVDLYRNDPNWIRPLDKDISEVFDPAKNKALRRGKCIRWILTDASGKDIGRIAAFINPQYRQEQPTGGIGFFECVDNQSAAGMMFDHAREWLRAQGMEAMDGPINMGERDRWWGLQVEGFQPPLYCMNYNLPYYKKLFEAYGFEPYFHQICFSRKVQDPLPEKLRHRHAELARNGQFRCEQIRKKELDRFASDFTYIYNKAWAGHGGGKSLEERQVRMMFAKMKPVLDERLCWFVYHGAEPVALWINLPDLNQYFRHLNGKFGLLQKLHFLLRKQFGRCPRFVGLVFGVIPEFQGKGVDSYMIVESARCIQSKTSYDDYEMQWIGDFNPKMVNIAEGLGTVRSRKLTTYRYLFDRSRPFKRHPMLS